VVNPPLSDQSASDLERSGGYGWTQPLCDDCWAGWANSDAEPVRAVGGELEVCCHCGKPTESGIYIRVDPLGAYARHRSLRS
jgi:hypothetical protein